MAIHSNLDGTYRSDLSIGAKGTNRSSFNSAGGVLSFKGKVADPLKPMVGSYKSTLVYNGTDTVKNVDVSSTILDARLSVVRLLDLNNEIIYAKIEATSASNVRITTNVALPAGNYTLIVLE